MWSPVWFVLVPILATGLLVLGVLMVIYFRSSGFRAQTKMLFADKVAIEQLEQGQVSKVVGVVRCLGEPLRSPLSNRECVFYEVGIERRLDIKKSHGNHQITEYLWKGKDCETDSTDFLLVDETGIARVDVGRSYVDPNPDFFVRAWDSNEGDALIESYLDKHSLGDWRYELSKGIVRLREAVLEPRETVVIYGMIGATEPHCDPRMAGLRELPTRAVLYGSEDEPVVISDKFELAETVLTGVE